MQKRLVILAGGTGGHLYPAQALAEQMQEDHPLLEILFLGGSLSKNRCFDAKKFPFKDLSVSPLLSKNVGKLLKGGINFAKSLKQSFCAFKEFRPDLIVGFGSYHTVAPLLVGKWMKIPLVLHEANSVPGKANRYLGSLADYVGVHFPGTKSFFPSNGIDLHLPLRKNYYKGVYSQKEALGFYGLQDDRFTLLIFGGSQGAASINQLILESLPYLDPTLIQILHITGKNDSEDVWKKKYTDHHFVSHVKSFEEEMEKAWCAADFFIGRSGASTLAEAVAFEVPGIVIPYPLAAEQHQDLNADFFVDTVQGGIKLREKNLNGAYLACMIKEMAQKERLFFYQNAFQNHKKSILHHSFKEFIEKILNTSKC